MPICRCWAALSSWKKISKFTLLLIRADGLLTDSFTGDPNQFVDNTGSDMDLHLRSTHRSSQLSYLLGRDARNEVSEDIHRHNPPDQGLVV